MQNRIRDDQPVAPLMRSFFGCYRQIKLTLVHDVELKGVSREEFDVLAAIGGAGGLTCKAIAGRVMVPNPTLTRTLGRMEEKGWVVMSKGPTDARQKIVSLTPDGQALYERVFFPHLQLVSRCIDHLSPEEQADLDRLLNKLAAGFAAEDSL